MNRFAAYFAVSSLCLTGTALAAAEGTAVGVRPDALARAASDERVLFVGSDVSVGETIVTGPRGNVQLLFDDQTRLVVGPGSTLEIETYLLAGSGVDTFAVNALAGTFRFISGSSPKSAYSINTPTASIAVRGTEFDLTVGGGRSFVLLYEGALTICRSSNCVNLTNRCDIGTVAGSSANLFSWRDDERNRVVPNFPLSNIQSSFLPPFRVSGGQACLVPPPQPASGSLVDRSTGRPAPAQNQPCTDPQNC
ncbi:FecR family protein [Devosia marina]|nr:FecR domain-containing protein [Devosia marina]